MHEYEWWTGEGGGPTSRLVSICLQLVSDGPARVLAEHMVQIPSYCDFCVCIDGQEESVQKEGGVIDI